MFQLWRQRANHRERRIGIFYHRGHRGHREEKTIAGESSPRPPKGRKNMTSTLYSEETLTRDIIGAAIDVHKELGPGLLETVYEECLAYELHRRKIPFQRQVRCPIHYKNHALESGLRIDLIIEDEVIVELKAVETIKPIHEAQLLTYLKLAKKKVGLLINFNETLIKNGIKRMVL